MVREQKYMNEIELIGTTASGTEVNFYLSSYKDVPVIEILGHGGRVGFVYTELTELLELLTQGLNRAVESEADRGQG